MFYIILHCIYYGYIALEMYIRNAYMYLKV